MLQIYNTLTRKKEHFTPRVPGDVGLYVCGMTVYDLCHLGHARVMVVFDAVYRHLMALDYNVTYVRNITDVDDKIIDRAAQNGETFEQLTERFIAAMHEDEDALGILQPNHTPRCTHHIDSMVSLIETLIDKGFAYQGANGDVYYIVSQFDDYGKLSGKKLEDLRAGERVAVDSYKRDPLDFVLWKSVKPDEPHWDSPWGPGRPGWHIECSAMAADMLGPSFDIHGGGMDLQFPHHENEIAQSEAANNQTFANYWMHNGFVRIDDEKMSKSLGNFSTIRDVLEHYSGEEVRLFILSSHYRSPLNYSSAQLDSARASLRRLYNPLRDIRLNAESTETDADWVNRFDVAMNDDFNTPEALAQLFDLAAHLNRLPDDAPERAVLAQTLVTLGNRLGLLTVEASAWFQQSQSGVEGPDAAAIEQLIEERRIARDTKDWARSDAIRDELKNMGVVLEDKAGVTTWRVS